MPREQAYFPYFELLVMLGLMEPRAEGFALAAQGATYLAHVQGHDPGAAPVR